VRTVGELTQLRADFDRTLLYVCQVSRPTYAAAERAGYDQPASLVAHLVDEPCMYIEEVERALPVEQAERVNVVSSLLYLGWGTDVKENDVVTSIVDDSARERLVQPARVVDVARGEVHVACVLEEIRGEG